MSLENDFKYFSTQIIYKSLENLHRRCEQLLQNIYMYLFLISYLTKVLFGIVDLIKLVQTVKHYCFHIIRFARRHYGLQT